MKIIRDAEMQNLKITSFDMEKWVEYVIKNKIHFILPPKISMKMNDPTYFYNVMPCMMENANIAGVKIVNRYPKRNPSLNSQILLYDTQSGYAKAFIDADFITTWRTAAVAVHSIRLLAKENYCTIAFIGLGVIGQAILKVYLDTLNLERKIEIRIFNYKNRAKEVIEKFSSYKKIDFKIYNDYIEMVNDVDVLVSAVTYCENDFCEDCVYPKGILIVPVHTRGFQSCDLSFDKVFCDDINHIKGFKYFDKMKNVHETNEILNNIVIGRESSDEKIIAYNIGIASHDIYFAEKIYSLLEK